MLPLADPQRFVGRHRNLVGLAEAFESRSRLITLHGPMGVGKSRMASEYMLVLPEGRRAVAVELSQCMNLVDAFALVASHIAAPPATGRDPALVLGESLRDLGPTTLVLDAVDGVRADLAGVLSRWLKISPETHLLITASQPLGIEHETALAVEPIALPSDLSERVISDALRLWHIARGVEPAKLPKTSDRELIRLLRALGGLPLAIEIAAAHSDRLTPFALLERLPTAMRAGGEAVGASDVILALLELVWGLLSKSERLSLAQCSVFAASFDRNSAHQVLALPEHASLDAVLDRLVQRRLVSPTFAGSKQGTYGLHDQVRRFAQDKLANLDPGRNTQRKHATFFVERSAQRGSEVEGPNGPAAILELVRIQPELMAIIASHAVPPDRDGTALALRALCMHDHVLSSHGPVDADLGHFGTWFQAPEAESVDPLIRTEARCVRAFVWARIGKMDEARADLFEAERLIGVPEYRESHDAGRVALTRAFVALLAGDLTLANTTVERSLQIADAIGHARLQGIALGVQSLIRRAEKKPDEAMAIYERALKVHRSVGNLRFEGIVLTRLAQSHLDRGELEQASALAEAARALHRMFGDRAMEGLCLVVEGTVGHAHGHLDGARTALEAARPLLRAVDDRAALATATSSLGAVSAELGDLEVARALFDSVARAGSEPPVARAAARAALWCVSLDALLGEEEPSLEARAASALDMACALGDAMACDLAAISHIFLQLARLRTARSEGRIDAENEALLTTRASLHAARMGISRGASSLAFPDRHQLVTALRFTEVMIDAHASRVAERRCTLRLPFHARWFLPPLGERSDATERSAMRRILVHLAFRASAAPKIAQSASALFAAGWPGENPGEENARLQVYAVLGGLRKAGLGDFLVAGSEGHFLDPSLAIVWTA